MSNPALVLTGIVCLALVYVVLPIAWAGWTRFRQSRTVRCPEAGTAASVDISRFDGALAEVSGQPRRLHVVACSLWPERAGCAETCTAGLTH